MARLISFLTTAYGTERYVSDAIESVLAQTRDDWELIVVDNGNSDELADIVRRYTVDPRVRLLRQPNMGYSGGVSAAAAVAIGRFVCVLDSDDTVAPTFCERIAALLDSDPHIDAVGCDAELFADHEWHGGYFASIGRTSEPNPFRDATFSELLDEGVPYYTGAIRREVWDAYGGYQPGRSDVEPDVVLWLRMVAAGRHVRVLPDRLGGMRVRPDSASRHPTSIEAFERRLQRAFVLVAEEYGIGEAQAGRAGMLRRLRYAQALRNARSALLDGDSEAARVAARDAFRQQRTFRAAAVLGAMRLCPGVLVAMHPAKNRAQRVVRKAVSRVR